MLLNRLPRLKSSLAPKNNTFDALVIGGGSGGLAFANRFSRGGRSVVLFDYVVPTEHGNKWGLGGTCVNVGCIPKKLFHTAALHRVNIHHAEKFGYHFPSPPSELTSLQL